MCDARFMTAGLEDVETGDRDVGKRPDNFFPTSQLAYNTYSHKREAEWNTQRRSNS